MSLLRLGEERSKLASSDYGGVDVDWFEDDDAHTFKFNVPGMKIEDVKVQLVGEQILQVSGLRKEGLGESGYGTWRVKERPTGRFFRKFHLPGDVKADEVMVFDKSGILEVIVPKRKRFIRSIPIVKL